jgi:hypothetical protein
LIINKKDIKSLGSKENMKDHSMPICFTAEQYGRIENIAKQKGMLNPSQLIEEALGKL